MNPQAISTAFTTSLVAESRDFYVEHLGARVAFDCGWYVSLEFGGPRASLQFMAPREGQPAGRPEGLTFNLRLASVEEVDAVHERIRAAGIPIIVPLEDHPWGDRGFGFPDPNGIQAYCYADIEPTEEFRRFFT